MPKKTYALIYAITEDFAICISGGLSKTGAIALKNLLSYYVEELKVIEEEEGWKKIKCTE